MLTGFVRPSLQLETRIYSSPKAQATSEHVMSGAWRAASERWLHTQLTSITPRYRMYLGSRSHCLICGAQLKTPPGLAYASNIAIALLLPASAMRLRALWRSLDAIRRICTINLMLLILPRAFAIHRAHRISPFSAVLSRVQPPFLRLLRQERANHA